MLAKKVLLIGATGFLGKKIFSVLSKEYEVFGTGRGKVSEKIIPYDRKSKEQTRKLVEDVKPDIVIDANGISDMDFCEKNPEEAFAVNVEGTKHLIEEINRTGAKFVFISTDAVFDGKSPNPYTENDNQSPINIYGKTKEESENLIMQKCPSALILRVSSLYGFNDSSDSACFPIFVINNLKQKKEVKAVVDWNTCPTLIDDVAYAIMGLLKMNKSGIYNVVGVSCVSRYQFALDTAKIFGLDTGLIKPAKTSEMNFAAAKPLNLKLSTRKLGSEGLKTLTHLEGLMQMKKQMELRQ